MYALPNNAAISGKRGGAPVIEILIIAGGIAAWMKGMSSGGGGGARTPNGVDAEERKFIKQMNSQGKDPHTTRRYLDWKRDAVGMPRRPGVNADILAPRNDASWTTKPGDEW